MNYPVCRVGTNGQTCRPGKYCIGFKCPHNPDENKNPGLIKTAEDIPFKPNPFVFGTGIPRIDRKNRKVTEGRASY